MKIDLTAGLKNLCFEQEIQVPTCNWTESKDKVVGLVFFLLEDPHTMNSESL